MNNKEILKKIILKEVLSTDDLFFSTSQNGTLEFDDIDALTEFSKTLESFSTNDFLSMYFENCSEKGLSSDFVKENYVNVWEDILNEIDLEIEKIKNIRAEFLN